MYISLIILCAGILSGILLFLKHPVLTDESPLKTTKKLSVIIPARNEENNLTNILSDLKNQDVDLFEIICVDDGSEDRTQELVAASGATLVQVVNKPNGWTGKSYACQEGANRAAGDLFLFLDADVRLGKKAVSKLLKAYESNNCTVSVQPYHMVYKLYEQLSLFFNMIMIAANGVSLPFKIKNIGLFGPVILISSEDYMVAGGHSSVKQSIVDDLTLGENLHAKGLKFKLYLGGRDISFRMYGNGLRQLQQGWTKNFATGALKTSPIIIIMLVLWIGTCTTGVINLLKLFSDYSLINLAYATALYSVIAAEAWLGARKIGSFKASAYIFYPVELFTFLAIFLYSMVKKLFRMKVTWKGRKI